MPLRTAGMLIVGALLTAVGAQRSPPAAITIDYPADGSIFPPEIMPPLFLWRDGEKTVTSWWIDISFADGSPAIHAVSHGERLRIGRIDPRCVADTNKLPELTPQQAASHTWAPNAALWGAIKKHSKTGAATVTITGSGGAKPSQGRVAIHTSTDPVGAPIFYRDVPLMPTETEKGRIKPLAPQALPLVNWRLRNVGEPQSRVVMRDLPTCANCHSFSRDGKTMGLDLDGVQNNKGMYALASLTPEVSIRPENLIQWRSDKGNLKGNIRVGFMSQVSAGGQYVVTTINGSESKRGQEPPSNYYVANFKDYKFLQVFYPTRGILSWYSRASGVLQPLPGADDPRFVQMGAVWSPDDRYLVFARAEAKDPYPNGAPLAQFSNDPNERQIQYDLYRISFGNGKGGTPEPIAGASQNGMSNSFPKVSPDGRWIVFVQCRNGLLMRPDSQLYIVPATGGQARRMRCNTSLMNSWHSFSPNGRWLVFSSKSRSPYTQMYLTHIDEDGNDSPAILIENSTAANRAVNLPEFVNVAPDGLRSIGGPAIEYYRLFDTAMYLQKKERFEDAAAAWRKVVAVNPDDAMAEGNLGMALLRAGHRDESVAHIEKASEIRLRKALALDAANPEPQNRLGLMLLRTGRADEAIQQFQTAIELDPKFAPAYCGLGAALAKLDKLDQAIAQLQKSLDLDPRYSPAHFELGLVFARQARTEDAIQQWRKALDIDRSHADAHIALADALYKKGQTAEALSHWRDGIRLLPYNITALRQAAWILATNPNPSLRDGIQAVAFAVRAVQISNGKDAAILDTLAAAYAEAGRFQDAALTARRALALAPKDDRQAIGNRIELYEAKKPFRDPR